MPNPTWPADLPIAHNGYTVAPRPNDIRTDMDAGPPKQRRRSTLVYDDVEFELVLTSAQLDSFKTFYSATLARVLPFDWQDWTQVAKPTATYRFRADRPPTYTYTSSNQWTVRISLEKLP